MQVDLRDNTQVFSAILTNSGRNCDSPAGHPLLNTALTLQYFIKVMGRFTAVMKHQDAPGTTFKRHLGIARGVLSEDDTLLREILFNPRTKHHVEQIRAELKDLIQIIDNRDEEALNEYLAKIRRNIR